MEVNDGRFQGQRGEKHTSFCFVDIMIKSKLIFGRPCFYNIVCACTEFFGEDGHLTKRSGFLELCIIHKKPMIYTVVSNGIREKCSIYYTIYDEENRPSTDPWGTQYMSCDGDKDTLLTGGHV